MVETSRGRDERREHYTSSVPDEPRFADCEMIFRVRGDGDVRHFEATYFISSLPPKVKNDEPVESGSLES
ncbi:hypothetical protein EC9_14110 [Rosistilla ulvae]|uniref:Uncharacterized protein n=1 Tax=Rosistilla ulvae TaxID=1930277 RepID=A0A517LX82_9BACT|nr:hypothetical protein [Rosistilla ulvae]QDS87233.1 hypothetical protein EC9_14110 [Rosistilla ulvae]